MLAALFPFLGTQAALIAPRPAAPQQWISPGLRRGDEVIYISGPDGVYIYRRHPAFELAGFLFVDQNVETAGPALDAHQNLYVVDFSTGSGASFINEYRHVLHGFKRIRQFGQANWSTTVTVGPDGRVYGVAQGAVLEWAASGGAPVRSIESRKEFDEASGVAVDGQNDLFVSFQFWPSGLRPYASPEPANGTVDVPGGPSGCHRRSGEVDEYGHRYSHRAHCVNSTLPTRFPGSLAFDAAGNLVVANARGEKGDIAILSPPNWDVSQTIPLEQNPSYIAFGAPGHLYYLAGGRVVERNYPGGEIIGVWWLHQPYAGGLAVGRW